MEAERKQREADRARRDAERAKKRLALKVKIAEQKKRAQQQPPATPSSVARIEAEQRKKILEFRKNQGRFGLPTITATPLPSANDAEPRGSALSYTAAIPEANTTDDNSPWDGVDHSLLNETASDPQPEVVESENEDPNLSNPSNPSDPTNPSEPNQPDEASNASNGSDGALEVEQGVDTEDEKQGDGGNMKVEPLIITTGPSEPAMSRSMSTTSWTSLEDFALTKEQEEALAILEKALEEADPDFYGFVQRQKFLQILKGNGITVAAEDEAMLMSALTLIGMVYATLYIVHGLGCVDGIYREGICTAKLR